MEWLEAQSYDAASPDKQRAMRKAALMPSNVKATVPEPYRLWRMCKKWNTLWWGGGISNQPHILMLEFMVCEAATAQWQDDLANMEKILRGD